MLLLPVLIFASHRAVGDSVAAVWVEGPSRVLDWSKTKLQNHLSHNMKALKSCCGSVLLDCQIDLDIVSMKLGDTCTRLVLLQ